MATLVKNTDKVWNQRPGESFMDYMKRTDKEIEDPKYKGKIVRFPYADGYALYEVVSKKPLKLKHLPYGDAWQIPATHIRGLRLADVEEMLGWDDVPVWKPLSGIGK